MHLASWYWIGRHFRTCLKLSLIPLQDGYLQNVLTTDLTHSVYNMLVKNASEITKNVNYKIMSKYFEMAAKLGGVSIILY